MTNVPEVKLAREAELCYATLALVTDYDVWHETEADVTVETVVANLMKNVATAKEVLRRVIPRLEEPADLCLPETPVERGDHIPGGVPGVGPSSAGPADRQVLPAGRVASDHAAPPAGSAASRPQARGPGAAKERGARRG